MVSTRQMSNVGGGGGTSDGAGPSNAEAATARTTRHSGVLTASTMPPVPPSSPQQNLQWTMALVAKCTSTPNHPRVFTTGVLDLPPELLEKIFSYLKFKTVAHMRMVCRQLNNACGAYLSSSFQRILGQMLARYQNVKSKMPRRESARRNHPLACESDIIETVHMRLALLQMTFGKHIERKYCCFFPGEILDEVYSILEYLRVTVKLPRPYKVTDELFDLSTMAMEYFKEHMEPNLPEITYFGTEFFDITGTFSPGDANKSYLCLDSPPAPVSGGVGGGSGSGGEGGSSSMLRHSYPEERLPPSPPPQSNMVLRKRIHRIKQGMKRYNNQLTALRSDLRSCKRKTAWQQKQIAEQQRQMAEQQKQTLEYATRLDENDKKNEETCRKFQTLLQELNKCRTELQYWRSKSPATTQAVCAECGRLISGLLPPGIPQNFSLQQEENMMAAAPTVLDDPGPSPASAGPMPGGSSPSPTPGAVPEFPPIENPMSPKALALVANTNKTPGSPKARRSTQGDSKPLSSDEGTSSKRPLDGSMSPHQDSKKRRLHRTVKPRKP